MATAGPNFPSTGANAAGIGTVAWTTPANVTAEDGSSASAACSLSTSNWLKATGFGFALPTDATVTGITVEWKRKKSTATPQYQDAGVRLVKAGAVQANDKSSLTQYPTALTYATYGSASDLWGGTWLYSDVNDAAFGAALAVQETDGSGGSASVDAVRITVDYSTPSAGAWQRFHVSSIRTGIG